MLVTSATLTRAQNGIVNLTKERAILPDVELDRPNLYFNTLPLGIGVRFRAKRGTAATQCRTPLDHLVNTLVDKDTGSM
jgi:hypothetical protein